MFAGFFVKRIQNSSRLGRAHFKHAFIYCCSINCIPEYFAEE